MSAYTDVLGTYGDLEDFAPLAPAPLADLPALPPLDSEAPESLVEAVAAARSMRVDYLSACSAAEDAERHARSLATALAATYAIGLEPTEPEQDLTARARTRADAQRCALPVREARVRAAYDAALAAIHEHYASRAPARVAHHRALEADALACLDTFLTAARKVVSNYLGAAEDHKWSGLPQESPPLSIEEPGAPHALALRAAIRDAGFAEPAGFLCRPRSGFTFAGLVEPLPYSRVPK